MNKKETVLVTGGGGGIGRELCRCFHGAGYNLVVVSLLREELDSLKSELESLSPDHKVVIMQKDLSEPGAAGAVFSFCGKEKLTIDILVNNVGFGLAGEHVELPLDRIERMMFLNMQTMTALCHLFGRQMKERGSGRILNVASTISFQPLPFWAVYAATKAYVSSFTQAFAREMKEHGVTVSCVYPGVTATNFLDSAGVEKSPGSWSIGSLIHRAAMDPRKVARTGFRGLFRKRVRSLPGLINKVHFYFVHWIPNRLIVAVVHAFMKRYKRPG
jgi:uncharacterized protein